jgi:hypothetical protein
MLTLNLPGLAIFQLVFVFGQILNSLHLPAVELQCLVPEFPVVGPTGDSRLREYHSMLSHFRQDREMYTSRFLPVPINLANLIEHFEARIARELKRQRGEDDEGSHPALQQPAEPSGQQPGPSQPGRRASRKQSKPGRLSPDSRFPRTEVRRRRRPAPSSSSSSSSPSTTETVASSASSADEVDPDARVRDAFEKLRKLPLML